MAQSKLDSRPPQGEREGEKNKPKKVSLSSCSNGTKVHMKCFSWPLISSKIAGDSGQCALYSHHSYSSVVTGRDVFCPRHITEKCAAAVVAVTQNLEASFISENNCTCSSSTQRYKKDGAVRNAAPNAFYAFQMGSLPIPAPVVNLRGQSMHWANEPLRSQK